MGGDSYPKENYEEFALLLQLMVVLLGFIRPRKFGKWTQLEMIAARIDKAVETEITKFPQLVIEYVSTALFIPAKYLSGMRWFLLLYLYQYARKLNAPKKIPLLVDKKAGKKDKPVGWDYDGRNWHYWSHLLAKEYGWELQYIAGMDTNVALAHIQEILTDEQLEREFLWGMSEIAYPYNPSTKKSKFSPLQRPYFMASAAPELKRFKIKRELLPYGDVRDVGGMEKYVQEHPQDKPTESE